MDIGWICQFAWNSFTSCLASDYGAIRGKLHYCHCQTNFLLNSTDSNALGATGIFAVTGIWGMIRNFKDKRWLPIVHGLMLLGFVLFFGLFGHITIAAAATPTRMANSIQSERLLGALIFVASLVITFVMTVYFTMTDDETEKLELVEVFYGNKAYNLNPHLEEMSYIVT